MTIATLPYPNEATLQGTVIAITKDVDGMSNVTIHTAYTLEQVKLVGALLRKLIGL